VLDDPERCVLVHVEPGPLPTPRQLLHLAAVRGDGQTLDALIQGTAEQHARLRELAGLPDPPTPMMPVAQALDALRAITDGASAVLAWKPHHLTWLRAHGIDVHDWHTLSAVWSNRYRQPLPVEPGHALHTLRGRASTRLGLGLELLRRLRAQAHHSEADPGRAD
jgi:hypothetical protein